MKSLAFSVCLFLNVMLFGMCGYMYLLWLQYWHRLWNQNKQEQPEQDMSDFRKNEAVIEYFDDPSIPVDSAHQKVAQHAKNDHQKKSPLSFLHRETYGGEIGATRLMMLKTKTVSKLRQALLDEGNNVDIDLMNPYGVQFHEYKFDHENLICDLQSKMKSVQTLKKEDVGGVGEFYNAISKMELFEAESYYNNCAVVTSAGSLYHSRLGSFIDSNDFVLRFNNAPVAGYENDVGKRTDLRILNSQILSKMEFHFLNSTLYKDVNLLVWDPSNYSSTIKEWLEYPEHNFQDAFIQYRKKYPKSNFHILEPSVLWLLWNFIQGHTSTKIKPNPPSSGFLGIALLLPYCSNINVMEYIPTQRATKRCHYYSSKSDPLCTYGVWHPLAAEKLISLAMNTANDSTVFYDGYISIPGYNKITC